MSVGRALSVVGALLVLSSAAALADDDDGREATASLVKARQLFFGIEHVDARTGEVEKENVLFSWLTNSTLAASVKGHVILLDTWSSARSSASAMR